MLNIQPVIPLRVSENWNLMTFQYFINYNPPRGWYLSSSPIVTANWKAASGNVWVVPLGGGVGRVFRLGLQPVNATVQFYGNPEQLSDGSTLGPALAIGLLVSQDASSDEGEAEGAAEIDRLRWRREGPDKGAPLITEIHGRERN